MKKLFLSLVCILFMAGSAWAISVCVLRGGGGSVPLSIIQHTGGTSPTADSVVETAFGSGPTVGNLMIGACSCVNSYTMSAPAGWSGDASNPTTQNGARGYLFYRIVQAGDGQNYNFTASAANDYEACVLYEVGGTINTGDLYDVNIVTIAAVTNPWAPTGVTPSYVGAQGLAFLATDRGTGLGAVSANGDWTLDESQIPTWHGCWGASLDDLSADTETELGVSWTIPSPVGPGITYTVMVNPG